jgi:hypothetical protein
MKSSFICNLKNPDTAMLINNIRIKELVGRKFVTITFQVHGDFMGE